MDAAEYFKKKAKMVTDELGRECYDCAQCGLSYNNNGKRISCRAFELRFPEKAVQIVEACANEKAKTYLDVFKENFPNARYRDFGVPVICRNNLYHFAEKCDKGCVKCWNEPYKE